MSCARDAWSSQQSQFQIAPTLTELTVTRRKNTAQPRAQALRAYKLKESCTAWCEKELTTKGAGSGMAPEDPATLADLFIYFICVLPACFYVHYVHAWWPQRKEEGVGSAATGVTDGYELAAMWLLGNELKSSAWEVFLTIEPTPQPDSISFNYCMDPCLAFSF